MRDKKRVMVILSHLVLGYTALNNWDNVEEEFDFFVKLQRAKVIYQPIGSIG